MRLHLANARLIDPEALTETPGGLLVENGRITGVGDVTAPEGRVIDCGGQCLAPGIVDIGVKVGEPGERHKESLPLGRAAPRRRGA